MQRFTTCLSESFCTSIAVANTMSAHSMSAVFSDSTFKSISRRSQSGGSNAETVNNPNGGNAHRLPSNGNACRKLQYVSGNSGLINRIFINTLLAFTLLVHVPRQRLTLGRRQFAHPCGATSGNGTRALHERRGAHQISRRTLDRSVPRGWRWPGN